MLCFFLRLLGTGLGRWEPVEASCSGVGWGLPHGQGFVQDWTESCQHDTLGIWGLPRAVPE